MSTNPGQQLKRVREQLGLSMRDVESAASRIAAKLTNPEFLCPISRISDIESKGIVPSIFKLFSFSVIYGKDHRELCALYGVDWDTIASLRHGLQIPKTYPFNASAGALNVMIPTSIDPGFDVRRTTNVVRMIQKWGVVPATFLSQLLESGHTYAFVGIEDFTMYPLVMPGSFLQIDENKRTVISEGWRSEYERPIFFIETRDEFLCAWCSVTHGQLTIQPHPLSSVPPQTFRYPRDADIVGQVVGLAMRLDGWVPEATTLTAKSLARVN